MFLKKKSAYKSLVLAVGFTLISHVTFAQETSLLRTDDFVVTKSGAWCGKSANVRATSTGDAGELALTTLASEIKFIFEFECPIAQHIDVALVGPSESIKPYFLSQSTNWKLVERTASQSLQLTARPEDRHLNSWRPDESLSASGMIRCRKSEFASSSYFINAMKFDRTKLSFYDLAQYRLKLSNSDRNYLSSIIQKKAEKEKLNSQIELDEQRRSARGLRMLGIKGKRSDNAKAAIQRLNEIGTDDPALQSIIEIAFDRMHAIDAWVTELDTEIAAIPRNAQGFSQAFTAKQTLTEIQNCIGWRPENSTLIKFMPEIIRDHEIDFFASVENKIDQAVRERTPFARDSLLTQIRNYGDAVSLEYFWDSYPDYIQNAYKSDSEVSNLYDTRLIMLKEKAEEAQKRAEQKVIREEKEKLFKEYNSAFLGVILPPKNGQLQIPYLNKEEQALQKFHEDAQLNSVAVAYDLSPEVCTTTSRRILYGGWAPGAESKSTSCVPNVVKGKEKQRKILAANGVSSSQIRLACNKQLKSKFCGCLSNYGSNHFTKEEFRLFSQSPRAYVYYIEERGFSQSLRLFSNEKEKESFDKSGDISSFMRSGSINHLMFGTDRPSGLASGIGALFGGDLDEAKNEFRKAQLRVSSNANEITTFCAAVTTL